jgi:hypothetical protein
MKMIHLKGALNNEIHSYNEKVINFETNLDDPRMTTTMHSNCKYFSCDMFLAQKFWVSSNFILNQIESNKLFSSMIRPIDLWTNSGSINGYDTDTAHQLFS